MHVPRARSVRSVLTSRRGFVFGFGGRGGAVVARGPAPIADRSTVSGATSCVDRPVVSISGTVSAAAATGSVRLAACEGSTRDGGAGA
jgi:hypothetical protein